LLVRIQFETEQASMSATAKPRSGK
jgi:hypothetical protein